MARVGGRAPDELRKVRIRPGFVPYAEGSALIEVGDTKVICAASVEETVPEFLRGRGRGWLTAEYRMLPRATLTRTAREGVARPLSGRTQEIQRLIGRSLRATVDFGKIGERTLLVDCDVLQADGGTRTAAITGAYVAVVLALKKLRADGKLETLPVRRAVAAVSVGIVGGTPLLDLNYAEDSRAEVDCNVVMTDTRELVEVQATAEGEPFARPVLQTLLDLAERGIAGLLDLQREAVGSQ
jgi:ribonuclease PH